MSNISNVVQFLRGNSNRYIIITKQDSGSSLGKDLIFLTDIPDENLEKYIKDQLGNISTPTLVWVEMRTKVGTSSRKENSCKIEVMPADYKPQTVPAPAASNYTPEIIPASFLGAPALGNNVFGLGIAEIMSMQRKAEQLDDKKEQLLELKEEYKDFKLKHEREKDKLNNRYESLLEEHRDILKKISVAEGEKDFAVKSALLEKKSFTDSPAFQAFIEKAPEMIGGIVAMKGGAAPAAAGLGQSSVSDTHNQFFDYASEHLNEAQINFLGSVCGQMEKEAFKNELQNLLQRYAAS